MANATSPYSNAKGMAIAVEVLECALDVGDDYLAQLARFVIRELATFENYVPEDCRDWATVLEFYLDQL